MDPIPQEPRNERKPLYRKRVMKMIPRILTLIRTTAPPSTAARWVNGVCRAHGGCQRLFDCVEDTK
jgi:hypothetical protein